MAPCSPLPLIKCKTLLTDFAFYSVFVRWPCSDVPFASRVDTGYTTCNVIPVGVSETVTTSKRLLRYPLRGFYLVAKNGTSREQLEFAALSMSRILSPYCDAAVPVTPLVRARGFVCADISAQFSHLLAASFPRLQCSLVLNVVRYKCTHFGSKVIADLIEHNIKTVKCGHSTVPLIINCFPRMSAASSVQGEHNYLTLQLMWSFGRAPNP